MNMKKSITVTVLNAAWLFNMGGRALTAQTLPVATATTPADAAENTPGDEFPEACRVDEEYRFIKLSGHKGFALRKIEKSRTEDSDPSPQKLELLRDPKRDEDHSKGEAVTAPELLGLVEYYLTRGQKGDYRAAAAVAKDWDYLKWVQLSHLRGISEVNAAEVKLWKAPRINKATLDPEKKKIIHDFEGALSQTGVAKAAVEQATGDPLLTREMDLVEKKHIINPPISPYKPQGSRQNWLGCGALPPSAQPGQ